MQEKATYKSLIVDIVIQDLEKIFSYSIPKKYKNSDILFRRVSLTMRNKPMKGLIINICNESDHKTYSLVEINRILDREPIFTREQFKLAEKISEYYNAPLGQVVFQMLPKGYRTSLLKKSQNFDIEKNENLLPKLNADQKKVVRDITESVSNNRKNEIGTHLLWGRTGSGKTRVYIELANMYLSKGYGVLYLVPEIGLARNFVHTLSQSFGHTMATIHSGLSSSEYLFQYHKILKGDARLVLGTRSSVFSPIKRLGLVIIDEEHDTAYKEQRGFFYHAKRVAALKLEISNEMSNASENSIQLALLMGSATPSIESYFFALRKIFQLHRLDRLAIENIPPIKFYVPSYHFQHGIISPFLKNKIEEHLQNNHQILLLLNRRGHSSILICNSCHSSPECPHCSVTLTYHNNNTLKCHYCGYTQKFSNKCSKCNGHIKKMGAGTQKVEEQVEALFPNIPYARFDKDTATDNDQFSALLDGVMRNEIKILIGTQTIAKGFDIPNLTLVGILNGNLGLSIPDFRASERVFQLISQVSGRAGRHLPGEVVLQTTEPEHPAVLFGINGDYESFVYQELQIRKELSYPPFSRLIRVLVEAEKETDAIEYLEKLVKHLSYAKIKPTELFDFDKGKCENNSDFNILGPSPAPYAKLRSRYRYHILLKSETSKGLLYAHSESEIFKRKNQVENLLVEIILDPMDIL